MSNNTKEVCGCCQKSIKVGNVVNTCYKCNAIAHAKCSKKMKFVKINDSILCPTCSVNVEIKYNPFKNLYDLENDISDIPDDVLKTISTLEECKAYGNQELSDTIENQDIGSSVSFCFNNLDGNKSNFDTLMAQIQSTNYPYSVIGLAETNTNPCESPVYQLDNYTSFYQCTFPDKKKGSGVALYVNKDLNATLNPSLSNTTPNLETIFVNITNKDMSFTVGVIYRPPNGDIDESLSELTDILLELPKSPVYLLGDFNIDLHAHNKMNLETQAKNVDKFEHTFLTAGYFPTISTYTHAQPNCRRTCIDNILTNDIGSVLLSGTLINKVSHHFPIFNIIQSRKVSHNNNHIQYYDYSNTKIDSFINELSQEFDHTSLPASNFNLFLDKFNTLLDKHCKLERPKTSKRNNKANPWITHSLINCIKTNETLYKTWKKSFSKNHPKGDEKLYEKYRLYRKHLRRSIKTAKSQFYCKKILDNKGNKKKTWEIINQLRGKKQNPINPQFIIDKKTITDRRVIANEFNKYFTSIASTLNKNLCTDDGIPISDLPNYDYNNYLPTPCKSTIFMYHCSTDEIKQIISELESGKSSDIPIKIIKKASPKIAPLLKSYFNYFISNGIFPDRLKTGRVNPIYKKDNAQLMENYRPVSTLPIFGKIFEKIIYCRLINFFDRQNIIHPNQFGFRKGHSTSHALNDSVAYIKESLDKQDHILGIFIDLSKAFDTLDHDILLQKLYNYGIRGLAHDLLSSYLTGRSQFTNVLNENSDKLPVSYGVPQGSILGPLLFLIYINDICKASDLSKFVLFADDTNIFVRSSTKAESYRIANNILADVSKYMKSNKLHINIEKCCYIYFNPKNRKNKKGINSIESNPPIILDGNVIKKVTEVRFLGVVIDEKLNWTAHLKQLATKLRSCTGRLSRIIQFVPKDLYIELYNTLFQSHLSFGISVWGGLSKNQLRPLFTVQKQCVRILFGDREKYIDKFKTCARVRELDSQTLGPSFYEKEQSKPLYNLNKILTVHNLYSYHCMLELFKILKTYNPQPIYSLFNVSHRKENFLLTPRPSNIFTYKAAYLWNKHQAILIGNKKVSSTSVSIFKSALKKHLLFIQGEHDPLEWNELNY